MIRRSLSLTPDQHAELLRTRARDPRAYLREIAAALLQIADGMSPHWVAVHGLLKRRKPDTVYGWLNKYLAGGLGACIHRPRGHRGAPP